MIKVQFYHELCTVVLSNSLSRVGELADISPVT